MNWAQWRHMHSVSSLPPRWSLSRSTENRHHVGGLALWHAFVRQLHLQDDRCQHDHTEARRGATCWFGLLLLEKPHHRAVICLSCTGQPSQRISEARCTCLWWPPRWNSYGMESWDLNDARTKHNLWPSLTFPNDILIRVRIPTRVSMLLVNSMSHDPNQKISRSPEQSCQDVFTSSFEYWGRSTPVASGRRINPST